jgi:hypothetical protein
MPLNLNGGKVTISEKSPFKETNIASNSWALVMTAPSSESVAM